MRIFPYRMLASLLLSGAVCLLTVAQTTRAFSSVALFDVPAVANYAHGFGRPAIEEVGSGPFTDAGLSTASSFFDTKELKELRSGPVILGEVEAGSQWSCDHPFHRRIPPRSDDDDN